MPSVTPSPLNTMLPGGPRQIEAAPRGPPVPAPADARDRTRIADRPGRAGPGRAERAEAQPPRLIEIQPDTSGFVPEKPPGPPAPIPPEVAVKKVGDLIEVVGQAEGEIDVVVGRSRLIQTRDELTRIAIANPAVADVELINDQPNTRLLNLYGRSFGTTDLTLWDAQGRPTTFLVRSTIDTRDLEARFKQIFPGADVHVRQASSQVILEGQVPDIKTMAEVLQLVTAELRSGQAAGGGGGGGGLPGVGGGGGGMAGGAAGGGGGATASLGSGLIINRVRVPGPRQVLLHVKIAELNRSAIRQIGVNWLDARNKNIIASTIGGIGDITASGAAGQASSFTPGLRGGPTRIPNLIQPVQSVFNATGSAFPTANSQLFGIFNAGEFSLFLNALRENSLAKIIAEPNLMTLDGQPAKFLAGGQFPYPVPQISSSGGGNVVTIQFVPYGALLSFLPNILAGDVIRLDVEPSFSELNFAAGTSVNGTAVPGITQPRPPGRSWSFARGRPSPSPACSRPRARRRPRASPAWATCRSWARSSVTPS